MSQERIIKIALVGNFLIFRNGLKLLLESEGATKVVCEAADLNKSGEQIFAAQPDVLLVNASEIDNGNLAAFFEKYSSHPPIVVLTDSSETEKNREYLLLGIDGLVSKEDDSAVLFQAMRTVARGEVFFNRRLMLETIKDLAGKKTSEINQIGAVSRSELTEREKEVLNLICQGKKNKLIAENLFITETTVRHHLTSIFEKLNVSTRLELVVYAFKEKLIEVPSPQKKSLNTTA